jgi:hypothetical protein
VVRKIPAFKNAMVPNAFWPVDKAAELATNLLGVASFRWYGSAGEADDETYYFTSDL